MSQQTLPPAPEQPKAAKDKDRGESPRVKAQRLSAAGGKAAGDDPAESPRVRIQRQSAATPRQ